jgi:hypothetical protein
VYVRRIDTTVLTFQASGSLWRDAMVMHDPETATLWSQVTGEAIFGAHAGRKLDVYPSTMTTFAEYVAHHPDGLILAKPEGMTGSYYARYYADRGRMGIFGTQNSDTRLEGKDKVIGLRRDRLSLAVAAPATGDPVFKRITMGEDDYWIFWDPSHHTAAVWLAPESQTGNLPHMESGSVLRSNNDAAWNVVTGRRVSGHGPNLESAPFLIAYWFAWKNFYPETELVLP